MNDTPEAAPETEAVGTIPEDQGAEAETEEQAEHSAAWDDMLVETGEKPEDEEAPGGEGEQAPPAVPAAPESDIWATATPEQRAAFQKAEQTIRSRDGREASLKRKLDETNAALAQVQAGSQADSTEPSQEWQNVLEEYPDIAKPFAEELARRDARADRLEQVVNQLVGAVVEDRTEAQSAEQEQIVRSEHPDYDEIADSDDFVAWAETQPAFVYQGIEANAAEIVDGPGVAKILHMYKAEKGLAPNGNGRNPRREIQLRSNRGAPASSPGAATREQNGRRGNETEEAVWAELRAKEQKKIDAENRA